MSLLGYYNRGFFYLLNQLVALLIIFVPQRAPLAPIPAGVWVWRPPVSSPVFLWESQCRLASKLWIVWSPLAVDSVSSSLVTGRLGKRILLKVNSLARAAFDVIPSAFWNAGTAVEMLMLTRGGTNNQYCECVYNMLYVLLVVICGSLTFCQFVVLHLNTDMNEQQSDYCFLLFFI